MAVDNITRVVHYQSKLFLPIYCVHYVIFGGRILSLVNGGEDKGKAQWGK